MPVHRQAATQVCRESVVVITAAIMVVIMVVIVLIVLIVVAVVVAAATTSKILETFSNGQSLVRRPENEPQDKAKDNYNIYQNIHNNPMRRQCQFSVKRSEERVVLTVAAEQQPCGVQVVERVGLVALSIIL